MAKKRFRAEQIIGLLRQAEVDLAQGQKTTEVCRKLGITEQTYYRWRKEYGGLTGCGRMTLLGFELSAERQTR